MQNRTMLAPNLYPASDSAPVLERDSSSGALGVSNDPLPNTVIHVARQASFLTRKLSPSAASRLGLFLWQPRRKPPLAMANAFHSRAAVGFSVRVAGDISYSEVHSQVLPGIGRIRRFDISSGSQKPVPAVEDQIGLTGSRCQPAQWPLPGSQRNLDPSSERAERNGFLIDVPRQIPVVEGQTAEWPEGAFRLLIQFVGIRHFPNTADCDLSRQCKALSCLRVREFVQPVLPQRFSVPGSLTPPIAGLVGGAKELLQSLRLSRIGQQFPFSGKPPTCILCKV